VSLSEELRDELAAIAPARRCCTLAELSALFHGSGAWHLHDGRITVELDLSSPAVARRAFSLLRGHGARSEIRTYPRRAFDAATRFQLRVEVDAAAGETLREAGVLSASGAPLERPPKRVVGRSCCRAAYLRGALLGGGSLSGPRDPHLELRTASRAGAEFLAATAAQDEIPLKVAERRTHALAYAKSHDAIRDLLAEAGAGRVALHLEEHAVVAATRAHANRLANADEANLVRTAAAAHRQLEAIRQLGLDALPPHLADIAELRLRYPEASLRELAAKSRPPLTRAAAHRRLHAIVDLVENLP
jgi:cell division protein WhiA